MIRCVSHPVSQQVRATDVGAARSSHSGDVTKDSLLERIVGVIEHSVAVTYSSMFESSARLSSNDFSITSCTQIKCKYINTSLRKIIT